MKDNFSKKSDDYAKFRPEYPAELIRYILSLQENTDCCWDCGTGNGQLASYLADSFTEVHATDISEKQLANAIRKPNIHYSQQSAETTDFPEKYFDLVTVAQAAHWFEHARFNTEVHRVLKPGGVLVLIGYGLVQVKDVTIQQVIDHFYWKVTRPYWDPERDHIVANYQTIPFPYEEVLPPPSFEMIKELTLKDLIGYISTWSAVQHYTKQNGHSPMANLQEALDPIWHSESLSVQFPLFMRVGRPSR